jgi:hypothetical protein
MALTNSRTNTDFSKEDLIIKTQTHLVRVTKVTLDKKGHIHTNNNTAPTPRTHHRQWW